METQVKSTGFAWGVGLGLASSSIIRTILHGRSGHIAVFDYLWVVMVLLFFLAWLCMTVRSMRRDGLKEKSVAQSMTGVVLLPFGIGFLLSFGVSDFFTTLLGIYDLKIRASKVVRIIADILVMLIGGFGYWRYRLGFNHK